ncbi:MAG: hypothetical protein NC311_15550, partial [Muribaculaceae bacterium]|nr:hypothetical protein [Muribaculaceae bacterium]
MTVATTPEATTTAKTVRFTRTEACQSAGLEVDDADGKVEAQGGEVYAIASGATYFDFDVEMESSEFEPVLTYKASDSGAESTSFAFRAREGNVYHYSMAANKLPSDTEIQIDRKEIRQSVKVSYAQSEVEITGAKIGNTVITGTEEKKGTMVYQVPRGKTVVIRVDARDNCRIVGAETEASGEVKTEPTEKSGFNLYVTADTDTVTRIESDSDYAVKPLQEEGTGAVLTPVNGTYQVNCNRSYEGGLLMGVTPAPYDEIEVKVGSKKIDVEDPEGMGIQTDPSGGTFVLDLTEDVAGKTIDVTLYEMEDTDDDGEGDKKNKLASYKLSVSKALTGLSVKGVQKDKIINQAIDTEAVYEITTTPAGAELDGVAVESSEPSVVSVELEGNSLKLTASRTADQTAKIELYRSGDSESGRDVLFSFNVKTVKQLAEVTPAVSLKMAGNSTLELALSLDKKLQLAKPIKGGFYYVVTATPKTEAGKTTPADVKSDTVYLEKTAEAAQTVKLTVSSKEDDATPWPFDVSVKLVQTNAVLAGDGSNLAAASVDESKAFTAGYDTRAAYYEDKLKLKKGTTTVYTGQQNVIVATPQFGTNTTFSELEVRDTTYPAQDDSRALTVGTDRNNDIVVSAPSEYTTADGVTAVSGTATGKHRLEVIARTSNDMYASRATIDVTVVRGIDRIAIDMPSDSMLKQDNKAASMKLQCVYNEGLSGAVPKTKKVTWEIVDADGNKLPEGNLRSMVSVKNGTVSVNKKYVVSGTKAENQFQVKVTAADYKNSQVSKLSGLITITKEKMEIEDIAVVKVREDKSLEVVARDSGNKNKVTEREAQELEDTRVVAFAVGTPKKDSYTAQEAEQYTIRSNISYQSGSAKAVKVEKADGKITVLKPAKKVKLSASAEDGSKAKKEMTITVNDDKAGVLGVQLEKYDTNEMRYDDFADPITEQDKQFQFQDSTGARFRLTVQQQMTDEDGGKYWDSITSNTSYKVKISGGKVLAENQAEQSVEFVANGEKVTITVTNNGSGIKKGAKKSWTYTLTNTTYKAAKEKKAPKVTLGSLNNSGYRQTIKGSFATDNITDDYKNLFAKIEVDWTAKTAKNEKALAKIEQQLEPRGHFPLDSKDGSFELRFDQEDGDPGRTSFDAGNYKMKASVGTVDANGNFNPIRKEASVTLKIVKPKAASFKMTTFYSMAAADSGSVALAGKGNYTKVSFSDLKSANVKGRANKFSEYFELDEATGQLKLTEKWYEDVKKSESGALEIGRNDLTGYVTYKASLYANYDAERDNPEEDDEKEFCLIDEATGVAKITVKFQGTAKLKYALAGGSIYAGSGSTVKLPVTAGKKPAQIAYAIINPNSSANGNIWKIAHNGDGVQKLEDGCTEVTLTAVANLTKNTKYTAELYIVPADSYYVAAIEKAADVNAKKKLIVDHGVAVKASVTAKDKAEDASGQIKIAKSDLKQSFTSEKYDPASGNYWLHVPYTKVYADAEIKGIAVDNNAEYDKLIGRGWFTGESDEEAGLDLLDITLNKSELAKAVKAGTIQYGGKVKFT